MLDALPALTERELGVAQIALERAAKVAFEVGPAPVTWLAGVLRRHKSFSSEGRVAALLAALRPVRAALYLRALAEPLHLSRREVKEALRTLETGGFLRTAPTIRTEALEITLLPQNTPTAPQGGPLAGNLPNQPQQVRKARRHPAVS